MKIYSCFCLGLALLLCVLNPAGAQEIDDWFSKIKEVKEFTARSDDGDYRLEVKLFEPKPVVEKSIKTQNGSEIRYEYKGQLLPVGFAPGDKVIGQFKLFRNNKEIVVDPKNWKDLNRLLIQESTVDSRKIPEDRQGDYAAFLEGLTQPRLFPSSAGDNVLIEWQIQGEGGSLMVYRWIVAPDGKTMFHSYMPLEGC